MRKRKVKAANALVIASPADSLAGYDDSLRDLRARVRSAQVRAALAVNRELVGLYWQVGCDILARQQQGWGAKIIERLAKDLRSAFPEMKGFSRPNPLYDARFCRSLP